MKRRRFAAAACLAKGLVTSIGMTLVGMLILAAAIVFIGMSDNLIRILNQILKVAALFAGAYVGIGRGGERGLVTGAGIGAVYSILGYCMYALLGGNDFMVSELLGELLICVAAGAASGVLMANLHPARRRAKA